jgi:phage tail sheath protein FI
MRPGVNVTTRDNAPPSTVPTDVGTGFMVGVTEAGPSAPTVDDLVQNMDEYEAKYAPNGRNYLPSITMYDSAETFFVEGGNRLYVGRVYGSAAVAASVNLNDAGAAICLKVTARGVGDWANDIDVVVTTNAQNPNIPLNQFRLALKSETSGAVLDESYNLAAVADAIQWGFGNALVKVEGGVSVLDPVAGSFDLAGGAADIVGINDTAWQRAIDSLSYTLGPGILCAPGATTGTLYNMLAEAARRDLRVSFLDAPDTPTALTLITAAAGVVDSGLSRSRFSGMFAPWLIVPGLTTATVKKVPPSAAVAGLFARNMGDGFSANEPAAGDRGRFKSVLNLTQVYNDADRQDLNANGVNVIRDIYGIRKVYGWRTVANPATDPRWLNLNNSIMHRQIVAEANVVGERFIFRQIDGQGLLISEFGAALVGQVCMPLFLDGSLYGSTPGEAFVVDVGPSVNTIATIGNNELRAVISVRMSPFGEEVNIEIVKYLVTEEIAA